MRAFAISAFVAFATTTAAQAQTSFGANRLAEGRIILAASLFASKCPGYEGDTQGTVAALEARRVKFDEAMSMPSQEGGVIVLLKTFEADPATYCPKVISMFGPLGNVAAGVVKAK